MLKFQNLARIYKQFIMLFVDALTLIFALCLAFVLRHGDKFSINHLVDLWWVFLVVPAVMIPLFIKIGLYRAVLQYIGIKVITTTFQATTIALFICWFSDVYV